MKVRSYIRK